MGMASGPEMRMMDNAPPGAVAGAQMVSASVVRCRGTVVKDSIRCIKVRLGWIYPSDAVENFADECVDGVLVFGIHLFCKAVGDNHAAGCGSVTEQGCQTGEG